MSTPISPFKFTSFYNPAALELHQSPFRKSPVTQEQAFYKMVKNGVKALKEHQDQEPFHGGGFSAYASIEDLTFPQPGLPPPLDPLRFTVFSDSSQGSRKTMEDVSFISPTAEGVIAGVLDGHSGDNVAKFAGARFQEILPGMLEKMQGHVHQALEVTTGIIQKSILEDSSMNGTGSTAVISVLDQTKHQIITATLGDSEANIYRKKEGRVISIPLSNVRDWTSEKDEARARAVYAYPNHFCNFNQFDKIVSGWDIEPKTSKDRYLRSSDLTHRTNV